MKNFLTFLAALLLGWNACNAQEVALSTNLLDLANFGTLNLEASYGVSQHWSLNAGLKYNPFKYANGYARNMQRAISVGTRYWPWHIFSGWWVSAAVRYQEYNQGGIFSPTTSEGDRFGGVLGGGYTYMISPHFNLDFGLAAWTGYELFKTYSCPTCGKVTDKGGRIFLLPSDIILSVTYIF